MKQSAKETKSMRKRLSVRGYHLSTTQFIPRVTNNVCGSCDMWIMLYLLCALAGSQRDCNFLLAVCSSSILSPGLGLRLTSEEAQETEVLSLLGPLHGPTERPLNWTGTQAMGGGRRWIVPRRWSGGGCGLFQEELTGYGSCDAQRGIQHVGRPGRET